MGRKYDKKGRPIHGEHGLIRGAELSVPCPYCELEMEILIVALKPGRDVVICPDCGGKFKFKLVKVR